MKKILMLLFAATLMLTACNKNKKFNKDLNGSWVTVSEDGQPVSSSDNTRFVFKKDGKDNGAVTITSYDHDTIAGVYIGTYKISDKGKTLAITATDAAQSDNYTTTGAISDQDDKKFTYTANFSILGISIPVVLVLNKQ